MQLNSIKLSEAHSISSKLEHQKKCLLNAEIYFEKHTTVKLLHCSLNSINEDEYTILKEVSKTLALRVDVLRKQLNSQSVKTQMSNYSLIELQFSDIEMIDFLSNHGVVTKRRTSFCRRQHSKTT
jgi:hypothetical protein